MNTTALRLADRLKESNNTKQPHRSEPQSLVENKLERNKIALSFRITNLIVTLIRRLRKSLLVRNTFAMLAGSGTRLLIQGLYFVLIARALGSGEYGAFAGVLALVAVLSPFSPLGMGQIIIRNVASDPTTFRCSWGNALWMTCVSGSILLCITILLSGFVLSGKVSIALVLVIGLSDLLFSGVSSVAANAFVAVEQLHRTAKVQVAMSVTRVVAALLLVLSVGHPSAFSWGVFYCVGSAAGAIYGIVLVCSKLGNPRLALRRLRSDLLEGFYFAISLSSQSIYTNIDKTMLVRLSTFDAAGVYAAAYRLVDLFFQPIGALLASTFPKFFQHGTQGLQGTKRLVRRFLPFATVYALIACVVMILTAPVLPFVLGRDFGDSVIALRWLSPLVLFRSFHYFVADALTGAGFQGLRSAIQVFVAGLNVVLNFWLIPVYSWRGAAWASLGSDGTLAACMFVTMLILARREKVSTIVCKAESGAIP
jgi:O-antigen/teichoic acid export membrane protein